MPTPAQLAQTLTDALQAIRAGRYSFAAEAHVESDMSEFGLNDRDEYLDLIDECIQIALNDPFGCFRHPVPLYSTAHALTRNLPMSAFVVTHDKYPKPIYFKFCLKTLPDGTHYCHIDCHESIYD